MTNGYHNIDDVNLDLKRLSLERSIAKEKFISVKGDLKESLQPAEWMQTALKIAGKLGSLFLVKKLFKR